MILHFWGKIIAHLEFKGDAYDKAWKKKLALLLGGCRYCNGFWVAVIVYILYYKAITWDILLFTGINYVFIKGLTMLLEYSEE